MRSSKALVILAMLVVLSMVLAISGCTSPTPMASPTPAPTPTPAPAAGSTTLAITGKVNNPLSLTVGDLGGYAQHLAAWQNTAGNSSYSGTGPYVLDLLSAAGLKSDATNVTFACTDPANKLSTTVTLADMNSKYANSIIAFNWSGVNKSGGTITNTDKVFQLITPSGGGKNQVGNITQITVS